MAGPLKVEPEELIAKGVNLVSQADQAQSQLTATDGIAKPDTIWEGAAANQYQASFEKWRNAEQQMIEALRDMGNFLQRAGRAYLDVDEALKASMDL